MIKETYIKEVDKLNVIISFEGDKEDIYELRNYANIINSVKCEVEDIYYNGFDKNNCDVAVDDEWCEVVSDIMEEEEDMVNHPPHYTNSGMECILEMVMLYGFEETMSFCKLNAHKYRKRALDKGGRMDMDKSDWYINEYKELLYAKEIDMTPLEYVLSRMN